MAQKMSPLIGLFFLVVISSASGDYSPTINSLKSLLSSSLSQIVWTKLTTSLKSNLSGSCQSAVDDVLTGLAVGESWSFALIDASAKTPAGLMDGTVTSFGDYDQCLGIKSNSFTGQHCMIRLEFTPPKEELENVEILQFLQEKLPVFEYYHPNMGICLPSSCSKRDIRKMVNNALADTPFTLYRDFVCDTQQSISLKSKWTESIVGQKVATIFIIFVVSSAIIGTISESLSLVTSKTIRLSFMENFSLIRNSSALLKSRGGRLDTLDYAKLMIIIAGVGGHCLSCLETIPGWYLIPRLHELKWKFSALWVQPLINEASVGLIAFVGGFVTFWSSHHIINIGEFRFTAAIFDRWIRYMPSLMSMVAIDLVWPFFSDGPMVSQISRHLVNKCSSFAWMNFLFLNNFNSAPDNCVPHTFYSSIDLQLFILGLGVTVVLIKKPRVGVTLCLSLILLGNALLMFFTSINKSSPVLIDTEATVPKTIHYLDYVHFATYGHLSNYFIGLLSAYLLTVENFLDNNASKIRILFNIAVILSGTVHFAPALHNIFGLLPQSMVPIYIVTIKFFYVLYYSVFLFTNFKRDAGKMQDTRVVKEEGPTTSSGKEGSLARSSKTTKKGGGLLTLLTSFSDASNDLVYKTFHYFDSSWLARAVVTFLLNLSYAIYICNYSYIRWDFFTSRTPMDTAPNTAYVLMRRYIYTMVAVIFLSYWFHVLFVAPFDNIRKKYYNVVIDRRKMKSPSK